ncbi:uncharacterized protein PgNI_04693, partial [Pyricularia grisea]|uniref:Uncharacterized protein n=1 Tax=Pyricularia grisea TaxID=148305 RepID=A0A6P8BEX3_PYRGI
TPSSNYRTSLTSHINSSLLDTPRTYCTSSTKLSCRHWTSSRSGGTGYCGMEISDNTRRLGSTDERDTYPRLPVDTLGMERRDY